MNRVVARHENPTYKYVCDCGADILVEHSRFQFRKGAVLSSEVQHCPLGQKEKVQGEAVTMSEKRDNEWVVMKRYPPVAKK